jgi:hypothetical protein
MSVPKCTTTSLKRLAKSFGVKELDSGEFSTSIQRGVKDGQLNRERPTIRHSTIAHLFGRVAAAGLAGLEGIWNWKLIWKF